MPWDYDDAWIDGGIVHIILKNAQDNERDEFNVSYYGQGDPLTDPAFTVEVQDRVADRIRGKEGIRTRRINQKQRFRPRSEPGGKS